MSVQSMFLLIPLKLTKIYVHIYDTKKIEQCELFLMAAIKVSNTYIYK